MYAIVEISGKQFKVRESELLKVPLQNAEAGDSLQFKNVLLLEKNDKLSIGAPFVKNALVTATLIEHGRDKKIIVFKKKRRKGYKVKRGHRQGFSLIRIKSIATAKSKASQGVAAGNKKTDAAEKPAEKTEKE